MASEGPEVSSFYLDDIVKVRRAERRNGTADLILREELVPDVEGSVLKEAGFIGLGGAKRVERLLDQARLDARAAKSSPSGRSSEE